MLPELNAQSGRLPLGRFNVTLGEVKRSFVEDTQFAESATRARIWNDFEIATAGIRSIVPVVCVWIGGSFLTSKVDPNDIDLVCWIDSRAKAQVTDQADLMTLQYFATNEISRKANLLVHTHWHLWHLEPSTRDTNTVAHQTYLKSRGFWDDFWMRKRNDLPGNVLQLSDALPVCGYLEVTLDDFHGF